MFRVFIVGPAGSGKSTLVSAFRDWLERNGFDVVAVNLDPAAEDVPYDAEYDVRDMVSAQDLAKKYGLGPNASIVAAVDYIALNVNEVREELDKLGGGYVLIDTPGQMEIFAYRQSGPLIVDSLCGERCAVVFLSDITLASSPSSYISVMLLSLSVQYRLRKPQVNALNKIDVVERSVVEEIVSWGEEPDTLIDALLSEAGEIYELSSRFLEVVKTLVGSIDVIPLSAKTGEGLDKLYAELQRIYVGGEDYVTLP